MGKNIGEINPKHFSPFEQWGRESLLQEKEKYIWPPCTY